MNREAELERSIFRRIERYIKNIRKMECEKMNFSPEVLDVCDRILAYGDMLQNRPPITRSPHCGEPVEDKSDAV